jgi:hypothetical protein
VEHHLKNKSRRRKNENKNQSKKHVFNFHLFGINGRFSPSYLPLIDLTVSENKAK